MFISVRKKYKSLVSVVLTTCLGCVIMLAAMAYKENDFGTAFGGRNIRAQAKLAEMKELFETCAPVCNVDPAFMKAIIFPEVMRFHTLKDGIETESLRTLYRQFGKEYADFSVGLFQMKPSFAELVENKSALLLDQQIYQDLQLGYTQVNEYAIRTERIERLQDKEWQLIYLTAFVAICNEIYKDRHFESITARLQWYATVYNAGFDQPDEYIKEKLVRENYYLGQGMPGKKFRYAAIAAWYFNQAKSR